MQSTNTGAILEIISVAKEIMILKTAATYEQFVKIIKSQSHNSFLLLLFLLLSMISFFSYWSNFQVI